MPRLGLGDAEERGGRPILPSGHVDVDVADEGRRSARPGLA